jgi:imidazolonepropionase
MKTLFLNIGSLFGTGTPASPLKGDELGYLPCMCNAWLLIEDDRIVGFGKMDQLSLDLMDSSHVVDIRGAFIMPTWCDSHSHIVFAKSREEEFVKKITGWSYAEIAASGGGILNSAKKLAEATEEDLFHDAWQRLQQLISLGTGALEIKSGYGLSVEGELKMLRVIRQLKHHSPIPIKASFLGAHAYPAQFKNDHEGYIRLIIEEMLPAIAAENLADYIDVFCEEGFFSPGETVRILKAGLAHGLKPKIHTNQFTLSGGVKAGIQLNALSIDHLEVMNDDAIKALSASNTIGVLLPGASFFLRTPYPRARDMIRTGCAIALASDYNPGSCPSGNMNLVIAMACIQMKMQPEEAINAATINGAFAMEVQHELGSISIGKKASFIITKPIPSLAYMPYAFGTNLIERVFINGQPFPDAAGVQDFSDAGRFMNANDGYC